MLYVCSLLTLAALLALFLNGSFAKEAACFHLLFAPFSMDFYTAVLHISLDNGEYQKFSPLRPYVVDFLNHHVNPSSVTLTPLWELLCQTHVVSAWNSVISVLWWSSNTHVCWSTFMMVLFSQAAQLSHRNAHTPASRKHWLCRCLENTGFFLGTKFHQQHHKTYSSNFSTLNGWATPLILVLQEFFPVASVFWLVVFGACTVTLALWMSLPGWASVLLLSWW